MASKKPPIVLDPKHPAAAPGASKAVQAYKDGVAARAAAQRAAKPPMPNLGAAQELYKPGKDAPMTIGQIGEAQRRMESGVAPQQERGLSKETIEGLKALHEIAKEQRSKMDEQNLPTPPMPPAPPPKVEEKPAPRTAESKANSEAKVREAMSDLDDLEFERILRSVQEDAINNQREREAVKKRVQPIDIIKGISTGEFIQDVPINASLTVRYRTITALENQAIRLLLFKMVEQDKRRENISAELYGMMQTICSVVWINNASLPPHLKGEGYRAEFDEEGFLVKFNMFSRYPLVLLHALGTHGYWFEQRVREAFTTDTLKNG